MGVAWQPVLQHYLGLPPDSHIIYVHNIVSAGLRTIYLPDHSADVRIRTIFRASQGDAPCPYVDTFRSNYHPFAADYIQIRRFHR